MSDAFFGYPGSPKSIGDAMRRTVTELRAQGVPAHTWEDLKVDGRVVISRILEAIDTSSCAIFDMTRLNSNVAFELGYALARGKSIRILLDQSVSDAVRNFTELATLKPLGYTSYFNSSDLSATLLESAPWEDERTAYDDLMEPSLPEMSEPRDSLLYCPTFDPFEASSRLSSFIDERRKRGTQVLVSDPKESSFEPITWLAPSLMRSAGVLVHFAGPHRSRSSVINFRHALVAGLARGLDTPTLMLAEPEYAAPFDYETLLQRYTYARECVQLARDWIDSLSFEGVDWSRPRRAPRNPLARLKFGEHVAENELNELPEYFVETSAYNDVIDARDTIFVGHRGTGKTANAFRALDYLRSNKTNLAVLIKPPAFEFPAMFEAVTRLPAGQRDYFFDALWRFVIQTEIGFTILQTIDARGPTVPLSQDEQRFVDYVEQAPFDLRADISTRLEQTLDHLTQEVVEGGSRSTRRDLINEAFHSSALNQLRSTLGGVLRKRKRVAILVDNLDKGWDKNADLRLMAKFILGLLVARGNVVRDFDRQDWWRDRVRLTVSVFLRSDIYHYLRTEAREPDKLPLSTVRWQDVDTLLHVLEARYEVKTGGRSGKDVWTEVFPDEVDGVDTRTYIASSIQPRPRDVLILANAAVASAIDRGESKVAVGDMLAAREAYSNYAFDALLVENGVTVPELKKALYALLGAPEVLTRAEVSDAFMDAGIPEDRVERTIDKLISICVLGPEAHESEFRYPEVGSESERVEALARRLQPQASERRLKIHNAYHSYLETVPAGCK